MKKTDGRYAKIVILSTLAQAKPLIKISTEWFNNSGRLFQPPIFKEINELVKKNTVNVENKRYYKADTKRFIEKEINRIKYKGDPRLLEKYKTKLGHFYLSLGEFTQAVYLNFEVIKTLTQLDQHRVSSLDNRFLLQLPFILRYLKYKDEDFASFFIQVLGLQEYVRKIEELEWKNLHILNEQKRTEEWAETFYTLTKLIPKLRKKGVLIMEDNLEAIRKLGK